MADNKFERSPDNLENEEKGQQQGLSKEGRVTIIVALITGIVAIITAIISKLPLEQLSSSSNVGSKGVEHSASASLESPPVLTPPPSSPPPIRFPSLTAQSLLTALKAANIDNSVGDTQILSWLDNSSTEYRRIAEACLSLLPHQRLKGTAALDVIVHNYKQVSGVPVDEQLPLKHVVNLENLKQAIVMAYNDNHSPSAQVFTQIVEPI